MTRRIAALAFALFAFALFALGAQPARPLAPIVVLVSFDGWRWDYIERFAAPNLRALASRGVHVRELIPVFPTVTFPNHYTIVTGLYPEHHGVVANVMRDPALPDRFTMSSDTAKDSRWWGGEPIWVTAQREGRRTAAMFWPGTEVEIRGVRPTYWKPFDRTVTNDARVSQVVEWLALPDDRRPSFITLYFEEVDSASHDFGIDSPELAAAAANLDRALGSLVQQAARLGLAERVAMVVVSDHGMAALSEDRVIWLDDYIDVSAVEATEWEGVLGLSPRTAPANEIYDRLRRAHPHLRVYTRETTPPHLRYRHHARIPAIVGIPDEGWTVTTRQRRQQRREQDSSWSPQRATHGFDPAVRNMHALFVAAGPKIRRGLVVPTLPAVDVYNFLCALLELTPAPNDGDGASTRRFLR